jgi:hypothetical protein
MTSKILDTITTKLWGWPLSQITSSGISNLMIDIATLGISVFIFLNYPEDTVTTYQPLFVWFGAVAVLLIAIYAILPSMVRILFGRYSYFIHDKDPELDTTIVETVEYLNYHIAAENETIRLSNEVGNDIAGNKAGERRACYYAVLQQIPEKFRSDYP